MYYLRRKRQAAHDKLEAVRIQEFYEQGGKSKKDKDLFATWEKAKTKKISSFILPHQVLLNIQY